MKRRILFAAVLLTSLLLGAQAPDALYRDFRNPPTDARPFVRWWWNGLYVSEKEILRELDVMKAAGIGGVEINSIAVPPEARPETLKDRKPLEWLSPEWNRMLAAAVDGARQRGMTADVIVGSGWPFGGRFLPVEHQTQRIALIKREIAGPQRFQAALGELARQRGGRGRAAEPVVGARPNLAFLRLVPAGLGAFDPGKDVSAGVSADGSVHIDIPEGQFTLYAGFRESGFASVKLGAPGSDGPVVDHWNASAVRGYLDRMSSTLNPFLGGKLGGRIRAAFVDSLELDRANWTGDFAAEFQKRRGYAIDPYLPFVLDADSAIKAPAFADTVRRARYDFSRTVVELFEERFLKTYIDWCRDNGLKGRIQAYGRETHPLEGSMRVDIPEGETWLWGEGDGVVPMPTVVNKYVSSGAHLSGKGLVSFEAMTNTVPVFRETPEDFKVGLDLSLLTGVNHPILHGFNYTPPEAGFPGWVRYGSYLNEKNSWWPYFHHWADYSARLTSVLRQTTAAAEVAILGPRADEWSRAGLLYQPFPEVHLPWYHYYLWQALQQNGVSTDYVSENVLKAAKFENGRILYGSRSYEALILTDVESLEPATAACLERYAAAGGKVIFVGQSPSRAPGLKDAEAEDELVRRRIGSTLRAGTARVIPAPAQTAPPPRNVNQMGLPLAERQNLLKWAAAMLGQFGVTPAVRFSTTSPFVSHLHHQQGQRDLFFFVNNSRTEAAAFSAVLPTGDKQAWLWDPMTGDRRPYPQGTRLNEIAVSLEPEESLLVVFEPGPRPPAAIAPGLRPGPAALPVTATWQASFQPVNGQTAFERRFETLLDISKAANDPALSTFAGTAVYRTDFDVADPRYSVLDLGQVCNISEVTLNGKPLGVRWYGRHVYDTAGALRKGRNQLEIKVTVMLGNYAKSLAASDPVAKRWAGWFPPIPAGLIGPVKLAVAAK